MKSSEKKLYKLCHPQKRIWYVELFKPGTNLANVCYDTKFNEKVNFDILEKAVNLVIKNCDGMRLRLTEHNGEIMQYIEEYKYYPIERVDFSEPRQRCSCRRDLYRSFFACRIGNP